MKVLLVAGLLLSCARFAAPTGLNRLKREDWSGDEKKTLVESINKMRRHIAELYQISNMQKVKYDDDYLVLSGVCSKEAPPDIKEKMEQLENEKNETRLMQLFDSVEGKLYFSCLFPRKTVVKCLQKTCENTKQPMKNCMCLGESDGTKKGKPGSDCDGGQDDGLCEVSGSSNVFTIGNILNLIAFYLVASFL
ncbi:unnamed protein product [Caenorhabditis nigoni]